jgi:hypothetical protein
MRFMLLILIAFIGVSLLADAIFNDGDAMKNILWFLAG